MSSKLIFVSLVIIDKIEREKLVLRLQPRNTISAVKWRRHYKEYGYEGLEKT